MLRIHHLFDLMKRRSSLEPERVAGSGMVFARHSKLGLQIGAAALPGGADEDWLDACAAQVERMREAEVILFEDAPFEHVGNRHFLPPPDADEMIAFNQGLVDLPADNFLFESPLPDAPGSSFFWHIEKEDAAWAITPFQASSVGGSMAFHLDCWRVVVRIPRKPMTGLDFDIQDPLGSYATFAMLERTHGAADGLRKNQSELAQIDAAAAVLLALLMGSATTSVREAKLPTFSNRKRLSKGLTPIPPHRTARLRPEGAEDWVWRPSAWRTLKDGSSEFTVRSLAAPETDPVPPGEPAMAGDAR